MTQTSGEYVARYGRRMRYYRRKRARQRKCIMLCLCAGFAILGISVSVKFATALRLETRPNTASQSDGANHSVTPEAIVQVDPGTSDLKNANAPPQSTVLEAAKGYDYSKPVPASDAVEPIFFNDAVFIGDSRTEGLIMNTGLSDAIAYTHKGLMVDTVFTSPVITLNGSKVSVMDALKTTAFSKVYIMLGINETGWPYNSIFIEKYSKIIDEIKTINPSASIYVQEILPVSNQVSSTHRYVKNEKINEFNKLIQEMAEEKQIYYIDTGSAVSDADGTLPEEAAADGIHLKKEYCIKWLDYLKTHTV